MPIFDQGYQHWSGRLSGHGWRWWAIARHGLRNGLKGSWQRMVILGALSPALVLAAFLSMWGLMERKSSFIQPYIHMLAFLDPRVVADPRHYRVDIWTLSYHYFIAIELRAAMILILLAGPSLVSQDLRFNALPLYFSRPMRRLDYFLGKLGVIAGIVALVMVGPSLAAYLLGMAFSLDWTILRDTFPMFMGVLAYGVIVSLSAGLLILALSALSRSSRYVALMWLGVWVLSSVVGVALQSVQAEEIRRQTFQDTRRHQRMAENEHINIRQRMEEQYKSENWFRSMQQSELAAAKTDWRPLVSYTQDLSRVEEKLLGTQNCWDDLAQLSDPDEQAKFLLNFGDQTHPWSWSAEVLVGLSVISALILSRAVKSLDRAK